MELGRLLFSRGNCSQRISLALLLVEKPQVPPPGILLRDGKQRGTEAKLSQYRTAALTEA